MLCVCVFLGNVGCCLVRIEAVSNRGIGEEFLLLFVGFNSSCNLVRGPELCTVRSISGLVALGDIVLGNC